jgi:hypothetical protein
VREKITIQGGGKCWISVENFLRFWQFLQKVCSMFSHPFFVSRTPFIHNIDPRGINRMCWCEQKQSRNRRETAPNMM